MAIRRYDCSDCWLSVFPLLTVQPAGLLASPNDEEFQPTSTNMRSFCCTPAGVFTTRVVPFTTVFVVAERSAIGVIFFTLAVTVQLGVVAGFSVS